MVEIIIYKKSPKNYMLLLRSDSLATKNVICTLEQQIIVFSVKTNRVERFVSKTYPGSSVFNTNLQRCLELHVFDKIM